MTIQQTMTQNIEYEIVQENDYNSFNVDEMRCAFFPRPLHCHPEYEITLIKEGEGFCFAGDGITLMRPMHIYFFGTNLPHFFKSDNSYYLPTNRESCHSIFTQFKEEVLPAGYKHMPGCKNIRALLKSGMEGMEWDISHHPRICQLVQDMLGRKGFEKLQAQDSVSAYDRIIPPASYDENLRLFHKYYKRLPAFHITLEQIAAFAGMNASSICRYFKRKTGGSIFDLILKLRIAYTKRQLSSTKTPVSTIAYDAGFNNLANFNVQFKKLTGYTPSQYRMLFI